MSLEKTKDALKKKNITYTVAEEDGCESLDFLFRGLSYHIWEFQDGEIRGAETNLYTAGRSEDLEGDYDTEMAKEILAWPDMLC